MNSPRLIHRFWKYLGWGILAAAFLFFALLPLRQAHLSLDDGFAFAQSGPPPGSSSSDSSSPPASSGRTVCSAGCLFPLPPDMPMVNVEYLAAPPAGVPPLTGEGIIVRIPAVVPITPSVAAIPVPSGVITEPVGLIPFDFGPLSFRELGTLLVPTKPDRDLIVRIQILPSPAAPVTLDVPEVVPNDWYVAPHSQMELGYGAPIPILAPGVTETNFESYATEVGLPTSPIPPPDADTAGVLETLPFSGTMANVQAVFDLTIYDADTGEQITIHLPELVLVRCFERSFEPHTPVLLQADEIMTRYDLPVQAHSRLITSDLPERITAYLLDTATTFVVATISGEVRPPLILDQPALIPNPAAAIPTGTLEIECDCTTPLPPGLQQVDVEYLTMPPADIPPLTGAGVIARIPAARPIIPPLAAIPVPSGAITESVGLISVDLRPTARAFLTLIIPADSVKDVIVRLEVLGPESVLIPIDFPEVIPSDWYIDPHPLVWPALGYGAPIPILAPGVTETNYESYATKVGLPTFPIPPPDADTAGVIATQPLSGTAVNVEAVFNLGLYQAETGEKINIHLPELVLGDICFEPFLSPYTPVLLGTNELSNRYDIPVQEHRRIVTVDLRERISAYLLETSTFVIATISGEVPPPVSPDEMSSTIPSSVIPTGLSITSGEGTMSRVLWGLLVAGGGLAAVFGIWFYRFRS